MLEIKNIKKAYVVGDFHQNALDDVSINFRSKEFVSILGPSGSGKTTLLNIIGGLDRYDSGDVIINNVSTKKYKDSDFDSYRNHKIGFVFQSYNLIGHQTVLANVCLALTLSGIPKKERVKKAIKALESVGLKEHRNKLPNQLSGGQMQRVAIARALVNNPDIILADEPTGALDSNTSKQIMDILSNIAKDKLVIMVTHNPELASTYSTRIINLKDAKIISDTNPYSKDDEKLKKEKTKKTGMSLFTALSLSLNNLMTKKGRTFLTAFAGSIGIIGIALILSLSNGVRKYIDKTERETLSNYPITLESITYDMGSMASFGPTKEDIDCKDNTICTKDDITINPAIMALSGETKNNLKKFKKAIDDNYHNINDYTTDIGYSYNVELNIYDSNYKKLNDNNYPMQMGLFEELINNKELLDSSYEILEGHMPTNKFELVLVLDKDSNIPYSMLYNMNILDNSKLYDDIKPIKDKTKSKLDTLEYNYTDFIGLKYKLVLNTSFYEKNETWSNIKTNKDKLNKLIDNGVDLKIVGVVKVADTTSSASSNYIGYTHDLIKYIIDRNNESEIAKEQLSNLDINVFTGYAFDDNYNLDVVKRMLGIANVDEPTSIIIYPKNYEAKDRIKDIINDYNNEYSEDKIVYTDYVGILMSGITNIINVITYILVAFVAISLIVSSIMISIITYISVLERTKEIGILRAIGASRKDVSRVFNAETIIEGFVAGVLGILVTLLLCIPINKIVYNLFNVTNIAKLPLMGGIALIIISVILTLIAGLIPAKMASKKDPVEALRTE